MSKTLKALVLVALTAASLLGEAVAQSISQIGSLIWITNAQGVIVPRWTTNVLNVGTVVSTNFLGLIPVGGVTNAAGSRVAYLSDTGGGGGASVTPTNGILMSTNAGLVTVGANFAATSPLTLTTNAGGQLQLTDSGVSQVSSNGTAVIAPVTNINFIDTTFVSLSPSITNGNKTVGVGATSGPSMTTNDSWFTVVTNAASTIPNNEEVRWDTTALRSAVWSNEVTLYVSTNMQAAGAFGAFLVATNSEGGCSYGLAFMTDAQEIEFETSGNGKTWYITSDDNFAQTIAQPILSDGNLYWIHLHFPTQRVRKISAYGDIQSGFLYYPITNSVSRITQEKAPKALLAIAGDSISEDINGTEWPLQLFKFLPTVRVYNESEGGTGYVNPGVSAGRTNLYWRLPLLYQYKPQYIILANGVNDSGYTYTNIYTNVFQCLTNIQVNLPATKVMVLNALWPRSDSGSVTISNAIKQACSDAGGTVSNIWFVDNLSEPWITGVFNNPTSGNAPTYTSTDATHPTVAGHEFYGKRIVAYAQTIWPELSYPQTTNITLEASVNNVLAGPASGMPQPPQYRKLVASDMAVTTQTNGVQLATGQGTINLNAGTGIAVSGTSVGGVSTLTVATTGGGSATNAVSQISTNGVAVLQAVTNLNFVDTANFQFSTSITNGNQTVGVKGTIGPMGTVYPQGLTNNDNRAGGAVFNEPVTITNAASGGVINPSGTNVQFAGYLTNAAGTLQTNTLKLGGSAFNWEISNTNGVDTFTVTQDGTATFGTNGLAKIWTNGIAVVAGLTNNGLSPSQLVGTDPNKALISIAPGNGLGISGGVLNDTNVPSQVYYVATNGNSAFSGLSPSWPWDVPTMLNNLSNNNTFIVLDGTWTSAWLIPAGSSNFTIRAKNKWGVKIVNSPTYGIAALTSGSTFSRSYTIDGIYVLGATNDGFGANSWNVTFTNCAAVQCILQGFNSSGIASSNNVFTRCLGYGNGATNDSSGAHYHNFYISGSSNTVDGCVGIFPTNGCNFQFFSSNASGATDNGDIMRNSFSAGATNLYGVVMWGTNAGFSSAPLGTNVAYQNTILDGVQAMAGSQIFTNNIILPCTNLSSTPIVTGQGVTLVEDYNLGTNSLGASPGTHDVTTATMATIGFVSPSTGLWWLNSTNSAAYTGALAAAVPSADFFGNPQVQQDAGYFGAIGFRPELAGDIRKLTPIPTGGANYWQWPLDIFVGNGIYGLQASNVVASSGNLNLGNGTLNAAGITNSSFTAVGIVTNDANGKTYTTPTLPNSLLANSSITLNGTAHQVTVSAGGATALGGTATFSVPNQLWATNATIWGNGNPTNGIEVDAGNDLVASNNLGQLVVQSGNLQWSGLPTGTAGSLLTNLSYGNLTGGVKTVTLDGSYLWPGDTLAPSWTTNTPGAGSGAIQSAGGSIKAWNISQTASNRWLLQWKIPADWDGNAVNLAVGVVSGTNVAVVNVTNTWDAAAALMGTAAGTAIMITNNLPIGTGFIRTNFDMNGITIAGSPAVNDPVLFYIESRGGFSAWSSTNTELLVNCTIRYTGSTTQNKSLTFP